MIRKVFISLIFVIGLTATSKASHIMGGEIQLIHIDGLTYRMNLIQYFDSHQQINPGGDEKLTVYIFQKFNDSFVDSLNLDLTDEYHLINSNDQCINEEFEVNRLLYSAFVTLDSSVYNHDEGYYAVWERCCRNSNITNVVNSVGTGISYVLEFPSVVKDGESFINTSPLLNLPLTDNTCVGQFFEMSFHAFDYDGDSLVYSLGIPFNSSAAVAVPIPQPRPFGHVILESGFSEEVLIPGEPDLTIDKNGLLTVQPTQAGLFAFKVNVKEYRNGEEIGQTFREFELLVEQDCGVQFSDVGDLKAVLRLPNDPMTFENNVELDFSEDDEACFEVVLSNLDPDLIAGVRLQPVNFNFGEIFEAEKNGFVITENRVTEDSSIFTVCIPSCPFISGSPYTIDVIAHDGGCPQPVQDTITVSILTQFEKDESVLDFEECDQLIFDNVLLTATGTYPFTYVNKAGCDSLVTVNLTIFENPAPAQVEMDNLELSVSFQEGYSYQWIDCDTDLEIEGENSNQFKPSRSGNFAVQVFNDNCSITSSCTFVNLLSLKKDQIPEVYPNPTLDGKVRISDIGRSENYFYRVFDSSGKQRESGLLNGNEIIISGPNGVYILDIPALNRKVKIIKM